MTVEVRHPFRVTLHSDVDDEQITIRLNAYGPNDARNIALDQYPDFSVLNIEQEPEEGLFAQEERIDDAAKEWARLRAEGHDELTLRWMDGDR